MEITIAKNNKQPKKKDYNYRFDNYRSAFLIHSGRGKKINSGRCLDINAISLEYSQSYNDPLFVPHHSISQLLLCSDIEYSRNRRKPFVKYFSKSTSNPVLWSQYGVNFIGIIEKQFNELASTWKDETGLYSLPPKKINATYLKIIAKGEDFLPFILKDIMKGGSVYWHFALKAITGNNDIPDDFSKSRVLKDAWIKWGKDNYII